MAANQLAEISEKFSGSWKLDRSESFEDFLREVGVNFVIRILAGLTKPTIEIKVEDETITISTTNAAFIVTEDKFKLREEFESDHMGEKTKTTFSYEDGKLVSNAIPLSDKIKSTKSVREIVGDELVLTMHVGDVVCKRYFKRIPN